MGHPRGRCDSPDCEVCGTAHDFEVPKHLVDAAEKGRLVLFAGAGISTENSAVFPYSFLDEIRAELPEADHALSFPETMERFCEQPDGRSRLLLRIRRRLDYVRAYPELYRFATRFHRELATMWQLEELITTNWDDYFERECGATPFITEKDLAFWSQPGRKLLKLHGSVHSLGDMVVTTSDYDRCYRQLATGVLGSRLKTLLVERTVVFVGYSLTDPDLQRIVEVLTETMGGLRPTYYIVTPEASPAASTAGSDIRHIRTDGTHFLSQLKAKLQQFEHTLPDNQFDRLLDLRRQILAAHRKLFDRRPPGRYPETLFCSAYQDGLQHAIDRILALSNTGRYFHRCSLQDLGRRYEEVRRIHRRKKNYYDLAYTEGYLNGLIAATERQFPLNAIPMYYVIGAADQPTSFATYVRLASDARKTHRASFEQAKRIQTKYGGLEPHHRPFLDASIPGDDGPVEHDEDRRGGAK